MIVRATRNPAKCPDGDDVTAERFGAMAAGWHRDEGFGPGAIVAALNAAIADGKSSPRSWGTYAHRALCGMRERSKADSAAPIAPGGFQGRSRPAPTPLPPVHHVPADERADRAAYYAALHAKRGLKS